MEMILQKKTLRYRTVMDICLLGLLILSLFIYLGSLSIHPQIFEVLFMFLWAIDCYHTARIIELIEHNETVNPLLNSMFCMLWVYKSILIFQQLIIK